MKVLHRRDAEEIRITLADCWAFEGAGDVPGDLSESGRSWSDISDPGVG